MGRPTSDGPDEADEVVLEPCDRGPAAMDADLRWEEALDAEGRSPVDLLASARADGVESRP